MELNDKNTTPVYEFRFGTPSGVMFELACKNHPNLRWITKNPWVRSLHYIGTESADEDLWSVPECACPMDDLLVIEPFRVITFSDGSSFKTNNKDDIEDSVKAYANHLDQSDEGSEPVYVTGVTQL
jgi:hypothetical protein